MKLNLSLILTFLSTLLVNISHACEKAGQADGIYIKGVVSEIENGPKTKHDLNPKVLRRTQPIKMPWSCFVNFDS